jgi:predicted phage terminase large subunit-like protein
VRMGVGKNGEHYITDVALAQVELADLPKFIKDVMLADGPSIHQGFENKGYMTRAIQVLAKDPVLAKFVIKGYQVDTDKLTRALPFAARATLELIHVADKPFAKPLIEELKVFPNGANDDQVDAASGAWEMINEEPRKPLTASTSSWDGRSR